MSSGCQESQCDCMELQKSFVPEQAMGTGPRTTCKDWKVLSQPSSLMVAEGKLA